MTDRNLTQSIDCPVCNGKIYFDARGLLAGMQFSCGVCNATIGLPNESKPAVSEAMEKIEKMKRLQAGK